MSERRFPDQPLLGVGIILLTPDLQRVLLVQRGRAPSAGLWTFPGGLVEAGERLRDACRRELLEETGLRAEPRDLATVAERVVRDASGTVEYHYVIADFWAVLDEQAPSPASDAAAASFVTIAEVPGLPTTAGVPEAIDRAVRLARGEAPETLLDEG